MKDCTFTPHINEAGSVLGNSTCIWNNLETWQQTKEEWIQAQISEKNKSLFSECTF
jgi:hypothetical protein